MREIKFRGISVVDGRFVYGNLTFNRGKIPAIESCEDGHRVTLVKPETVGQYIGIKDKVGNNIYEGDVVRFVSSSTNEYIRDYGMHPMRWAFIIEIKNGCSGYSPLIPSLHHDDTPEWDCIYSTEDKAFEDFSDVEVIGNIHQNPELLEIDDEF
jgi:uncharacterized phage protein (TIGR01671 family)